VDAAAAAADSAATAPSRRGAQAASQPDSGGLGSPAAPPLQGQGMKIMVPAQKRSGVKAHS